jgi:hypothetical protein
LVSAVADDTEELGRLVAGAHAAGPAPGPSIEKLWAEAVYEQVRLEMQPDAPSRLECIFASEMGNQPFDILDELGGAPAVFAPSGVALAGPMIVPATTRGRWIALDMHLFKVAGPLIPDPAVLEATRIAYCDLAERYWSGQCTDQPLTDVNRKRKVQSFPEANSAEVGRTRRP